MSSTNNATLSWPLSVDIDVFRHMSLTKRRQIFMTLTREERIVTVDMIVARDRECLWPPGSFVTYVNEVAIVLARNTEIDVLSIDMTPAAQVTRIPKEVRLIWSSTIQNMKWVSVDALGPF